MGNTEGIELGTEMFRQWPRPSGGFTRAGAEGHDGFAWEPHIGKLGHTTFKM